MVSPLLHVWLGKKRLAGKGEHASLVYTGEEMLPKLTVLIHSSKIFLCRHFTFLILGSETQVLVMLFWK